MITDEQLAEWRKLARFAEHEGWEADGTTIHRQGHECVGDFTNEWEAKLAEDLRRAVPALLDEVERLRSMDILGEISIVGMRLKTMEAERARYIAERDEARDEAAYARRELEAACKDARTRVEVAEAERDALRARVERHREWLRERIDRSSANAEVNRSYGFQEYADEAAAMSKAYRYALAALDAEGGGN